MDRGFGDIMISYAWDSSDPTHQPWVINLDARLQNSGFSTTLDVRSLPILGPGNVNLWMERAVASAKWIVAIVTQKYTQKCDDRDDGNSLGYEIDQIISRFVNTGRSNRIISVLRPGAFGNPRFIPLALWIDFRDETLFEQKLLELIARLKSLPASLNQNPNAAKTATTVVQDKNYQNIGTIPLHDWYADSGKSVFSCSSDSGIKITIVRQPDWLISEKWALAALGHGAFKAVVVLQHKQQETCFDFACAADNKSFLPYPENVNGRLVIGYMPNWIAEVLNHSVLGKHYENLKKSAGLQSL